MITRGTMLLVGLALGAQGCLLAGNYHSAKTLGKGESSQGLTFSVTTYKYLDTTVTPAKEERFALPNLIPELTYHIGFSDDVEIGGRVGLGSLALEGDVKYRFLRSDKLHMAIAPAVSYQAFGKIEGVGARLPGILTYDLAPNFAFTGALFISTTHYTAVDPNDSGSVEFAPLTGTLGSTGIALGFEIRGETFEIRPSVEFTQYALDLSGDNNFEQFNTVNVLVHVVSIGGREKKQLNRIEQKIDNLGGGAPPPETYAPPPAPHAPPPPPPPPAPEPPPGS